MPTQASLQQQSARAATRRISRQVSRAGQGGAWILFLLAGLWVTAFAVAGTWCAYWDNQRNDQYQLIHLGDCVRNGGRLYVDCWENKPPGIAWLNAAGVVLAGGRELGAWLLPGLTALLGIGTLGLAMARLLSGPAALVTLLMASVVTTARLYDGASINPDFYAAMFAMAACSLWLLSSHETKSRRIIALGIAAGLLWAAATTVKQTGLAGLLVVSVITLLFALIRSDSGPRWLVAGAWTWIGFALGVAAVTAVLQIRGTVEPAWEAVWQFNRPLWSSERLLGALRTWSRSWNGLSPVQLPLWLALLGILPSLRVRQEDRLSPAFTSAMLLWWLAEVLFALLGPSHSMRYWQATFPPMLWLAGAGVHHLEDMFRKVGHGYRSALALACATLVLVLGRPLFDHYRYGLAASRLVYTSKDTQRDRLKAMGAQVAALVPEDQSIYVWDYDPGVYVHSRRRAASRFTYPRSAEQMERILIDLKERKPFALLIPDKGSPEFNRWCDEACHRQLDDILTGYENSKAVESYHVWLLAPSREEETLMSLQGHAG